MDGRFDQFVLSVKLNAAFDTPKKFSLTGNLTCEVSDGYISSDKKISLNIIGKPIVSISPRTSTVTQGDTVNIYCNVVQSFSVLTSILWYKNGDTFNPNKGK